MTHSSPSTSVPPTRIAIAGFGAWGQMHARAIGAIDGAVEVQVAAAALAPVSKQHAEIGTVHDAVRLEVGTPVIFSPSSRTRSPRQRTIHAAVDPVPSPTRIPS